MKINKLTTMRWLVVLGSLAVLSGCKPEDKTVPPGTPLATYVYTDPRNGQKITFTNDREPGQSFSYNEIDEIQRAMQNLPLSHLAGITNLNLSSYSNQVAANVYNNVLTDAERNEWTNRTGKPDPNPETTYSGEYTGLLLAGIQDLSLAIRAANGTHDGHDIAASLMGVAPFIDKSNGTILYYQTTSLYAGPTFIPQPVKYTLTSTKLTINSIVLTLSNGNIVAADDGFVHADLTPIALPQMFVSRAGGIQTSLTDTSIQSGTISPSNGGSIVHPNGVTNYVSPTPYNYLPLTSPKSQTAITHERQNVSSSPKSLLTVAPGATSHGISQ